MPAPRARRAWCIATSGPGATNLVTGIATAYMDSVPMVAITGNVNLNLLGLDSFQEVDITGITMPITKHNYIVKDVHDLAQTLREAFQIAGSGRKGPVLVDIPKDITGQTCEFERSAPLPPLPHDFPVPERFEKAVEMISRSAAAVPLCRRRRDLLRGRPGAGRLCRKARRARGLLAHVPGRL